MRHAIRTHLKDFAAIAALLAVAVLAAATRVSRLDGAAVTS